MTKFLTAAITSIALLGAPAALASTVTFNLSTFVSGPTVTFGSASGLTLALSNGLSANGEPINLVNALGGLALSDGGTAAQLDLTFNSDVRLVSYVVSNAETDGDGAFFNLSQGATVSANNSVATTGSFAFANPGAVFAGGLGITLLSGDAVGGLSGALEFEAWALSSITVERVLAVAPPTVTPPAIPLPASILTLAAAMGSLSLLRRRRVAA